MREIVCACALWAQVQSIAEPGIDKAFESAVSFAQSMSQWAYLTIGASVAFLAKELAQRPKNAFVRWFYLIFIPGWLFLARAIWKGMRVHSAYIAYLMNPRHDVTTAIKDINADAASQLSALKCGLVVFFVWLVGYLLWWMAHREGPKANENINYP